MSHSSDRHRNTPSPEHVTEMLKSTSQSYEDLPDSVSYRLDTVLSNLPSAETLHHEKPSLAKSWTRRFQMPRFRYAFASAATAVLVTVGGVWVAAQFAQGTDPNSEPPSIAGEDPTSEEHDDSPMAEDDDDPGTMINPEGDSPEADEEALESPQPPSESAIDTHTSGESYTADDDLAEALRDLADEDVATDVPDDLSSLYSNAEAWDRCESSILRHYDAIPIMADFAEFENEPAMVVFLVGEDGDAVAVLGPECGVQDVDEQFLQPAG